jgi:hypothetical protein
MPKHTKIGDVLTMKGTIAQNVNGHELQLFDGRYDTGYKILSFVIAPKTPTAAQEWMSTLSTSKTVTSISQWDFANVQQIGWASWGIPGAAAGEDFKLIDRDNLIIENLFISTYQSTGDASELNYYVLLQKYKINTWDGALNMVTNLSQGGAQ